MSKLLYFWKTNKFTYVRTPVFFQPHSQGFLPSRYQKGKKPWERRCCFSQELYNYGFLEHLFLPGVFKLYRISSKNASIFQEEQFS